MAIEGLVNVKKKKGKSTLNKHPIDYQLLSWYQQKIETIFRIYMPVSWVLFLSKVEELLLQNKHTRSGAILPPKSFSETPGYNISVTYVLLLFSFKNFTSSIIHI